MNVYNLSLRVPENRLATIISAIEGSCSILGLTLMNNSDAIKEPASYNRSAASETNMGCLLVEILKSKNQPMSINNFRENALFMSSNFKPTSVGPCLSALYKEGMVSRTGKRGELIYSLVKK